MRPEDAAAMAKMATLVANSDLTMWASTVAREEIDKIPERYRKDHVDQFNTLKTIRASNATWVETNELSSAFGKVVVAPDYLKLRAILRDENDARLVFQAKAAGVTDFVTVDYKSVLSKADELKTIGVRAMSPSGYLLSRTTSAPEAVS